MKNQGNLKILGIFTATLLVLSFSLALVYHLIGGKWHHHNAAIIITLNSFIPLIVVIMLHKFILNTPISNSVGKIKIWNLWNVVVILGPMVYVLLTIVLLSLFPGIEINPNQPLFLEQFKIFLSPLVYDNIYIDAHKSGVPIFWWNLLVPILWGLTFNFVIGFCEEIAWRGFLFYQLQQQSFLKQTLIQGTIWALWYAPFVWFAAVINPLWAVIINSVFFILLSPIYLLVRYASNSTISVAILHGVIVSYSYFADVVIKDDPTQWLSSYIQVNFYLLILCNLILFIYLYSVNPIFKVEFQENTTNFVRKTVSIKPVKKNQE
ncbi:MAG: hypothetical protein KatS3mg035_1256 [Bacteroidia bacterium]|nr:MAG: hypothetical protein KatS3mg035_1256 [Bacteroidia bacterium]